MSFDPDRIARNLGTQFDGAWPSDWSHVPGAEFTHGYRVVGQPEMEDYLASGQIRSPHGPTASGFTGSGQIHVSRVPAPEYAGAIDPSGPQYVLQIDMTKDEWDPKSHGADVNQTGAVHRSESIPLDRMTAAWGYPNKKALYEHMRSDPGR